MSTLSNSSNLAVRDTNSTKLKRYLADEQRKQRSCKVRECSSTDHDAEDASKARCNSERDWVTVMRQVALALYLFSGSIEKEVHEEIYLEENEWKQPFCTVCECSTRNKTSIYHDGKGTNKTRCNSEGDLFCKARQVRNKILHSFKEKSESELEKILNQMISILQNMAKTGSDIQQSIIKIEQLKEQRHSLTKKHLKRIRRVVQQAVTEREKEIHTLLNEMKRICNEKEPPSQFENLDLDVPTRKSEHLNPEVDICKGRQQMMKIIAELEDLAGIQRSIKHNAFPFDDTLYGPEGDSNCFADTGSSYGYLVCGNNSWCGHDNEKERMLSQVRSHKLLSKLGNVSYQESPRPSIVPKFVGIDQLMIYSFKRSAKYFVLENEVFKCKHSCTTLELSFLTECMTETVKYLFTKPNTDYSYISVTNKYKLWEVLDQEKCIEITISDPYLMFISTVSMRTINPMKIFNAWLKRLAFLSLEFSTKDIKTDDDTDICILIVYLLVLSLLYHIWNQHCYTEISDFHSVNENENCSEGNEASNETEKTDSIGKEDTKFPGEMVTLHKTETNDSFGDPGDPCHSGKQKLNERTSDTADDSTVSLKDNYTSTVTDKPRCKVLNNTVDLKARQAEGEGLLSLSKGHILVVGNEDKEKEDNIKGVIKGNSAPFNVQSTYIVAPVTKGQSEREGSYDDTENTTIPSASGYVTSEVDEQRNACLSKTKKRTSKKKRQSRPESLHTDANKSESLAHCIQQNSDEQHVELDSCGGRKVLDKTSGDGSTTYNAQNVSKISTDGHTSANSLNVLKGESENYPCMAHKKYTSLQEGAVGTRDEVIQVSCGQPYRDVSRPTDFQICLKENPENLHGKATSSSNEENSMANNTSDPVQANGNMTTSSHTSTIDNETRSSHISNINNETRSENFPNPHIDPSVIQRFEPLMTIVDKIANGERVPPQITMRYEMLRFCTLRSYPKENKPFITRIAEAGFYYANVDDEVVCYCCARRKRNWRENDIPMDVHRQLNPNCKFLRRNSEVNVPIKTDMSTVNAHASSEMPIMSSSSPHSHLPQNSYIGGYVGSENSVQHSQQIVNFGNTPGNTLNQNEIRQDELVSSSSCSRVSSEIFPQTQTRAHGNFAQGSIARPVEYQRQNAATASSTSGLGNSGHNNTSQSANQGSAMPKYPKYASKTVRLSSFNDCNDIVVSPDYLSVAGFFYAGFGDCVRCFQCGVGLRHWSEEDDPWIEHSRWSKDCSFVRQMRGEEFVSIVQQAVLYSQNQNRQENNQSSRSGNVTGNGNENGGGEIERLLHTDSAQSVLEMGYHPDLIRRAIRGVLEVHGRSGISAYNLMEKIFEMEAAESGINTEQNDEDTEERTRSTNSSISRRTGLDSFSNSSLDRSAESQPQVGAEGRSSATIDNKEAQSAHAGTSDLKKASKKSQLLEQKKLKEENEMLKQQSICTVCKERDVCIVFLPCGHLVTCETCAPTVRHCTVQTCGRYIKGTVRTYLG